MKKSNLDTLSKANCTKQGRISNRPRRDVRADATSAISNRTRTAISNATADGAFERSKEGSRSAERSFPRVPRTKHWVICAVLLTPESVTITNIPDILDVNLLIDLLGDMGVVIDRPSSDTCTFTARDVNLDFLQTEAFKEKAGVSVDLS